MPLCIIRIYRSTVNAKLDDFSPLHQHHLSQQFYNLNENKISKLTHFVLHSPTSNFHFFKLLIKPEIADMSQPNPITIKAIFHPIPLSNTKIWSYVKIGPMSRFSTS